MINHHKWLINYRFLIVCPSDGGDAEFHLARLEQFFAAGDEGGACGADVIDDKQMLAGKIGDGMFAVFVVIGI